MSRQEAIAQYGKALKEGRRCYRECVRSGRYPYLQVLDEILSDAEIQGTVDLGQVEIPMDQIAGTRESGRKIAFAADFMPLLDPDTEFGSKWISLCEAHLEDTGIQSPIRAYEYMGRFYVQEGNKRVSVMKSFGAMSIAGNVIRIVPAWSDDMATRVYYEYLDFYSLSGICQVHFNQVGGFAKIQAALGFDPDHVWTQDERRGFISYYYRFKKSFARLGIDEHLVTCAEALLVWLQVYPLSYLKSMTSAEMDASVDAIRKDIEAVGKGGPISVNMEPTVGSEGVIDRLIDTVMSPKVLNVTFVHETSPETSLELAAHERGMRSMEQALKGHVVVTERYADAGESPEDIMFGAAEGGADVLIATSPSLIFDCRKVAARYPRLKVLNRSAAMPYAGVRTYSDRSYETDFICGAIAGSLAKDEPIGYVANAPILGTPARINAFALGTQLTSANAKVRLLWSSVDANPFDELVREGVRIISHCDIPTPVQEQEYEGLCAIDKGRLDVLAVPTWDWGEFYTKLVGSILWGGWDALEEKDEPEAVSYWWGIGSGVIDVELGQSLPDGPRALAQMLRDEISSDRIRVFHRQLRRADGSVVNTGERWLGPEEILGMDWLVEGVEGRIPSYDEVLPEVRGLVRAQGVNRMDLPPEKGGPLI